MVLKHVCLAREFNNSATQKSQNIQFSCPRDEFSFHFGNQSSHKKEGKGASLVPIKRRLRDSLVIQWLRLQIPNAGGPMFCPWSGN